MRAYTTLLLCALTLWGLACKDGDDSPAGSPAPPDMPDGRTTPTPSASEPGRSDATPWAAGGTTGDFGGDCARCEAPEFQDLALDDDEPLGFSPAQVLAVVEGVHVGAVRWRDACADGPCEPLDLGCPRDPLPLAGTETELRVELRRAGAPVLETCPARGGSWVDAGGIESCIGTYLHIPIEVDVSTSDGALSARIEGKELFVEPGSRAVGIGASLTPDQLEGSLASTLPELETVDWQIWFDEDGVGADLYLLGAETGTRAENLGQLEAAGEVECLVGFPLTTQ